MFGRSLPGVDACGNCNRSQGGRGLVHFSANPCFLASKTLAENTNYANTEQYSSHKLNLEKHLVKYTPMGCMAFVLCGCY